MFRLLSLSLAILPCFCSASVARDRDHVDPQERALSVLASPSLELISDPGMGPVDVGVETPSGNDLMVSCHSGRGISLNARSCFEALAQGPDDTDTRQESWGNNIPGRRVDFTLPAVYMGGDFTCGIYLYVPVSVPATTIAHASPKNVSDAAKAVIRECVIKRRIGGIAQQIGGDNKLMVTVSALVGLRAICTGNVITPSRSCEYIMDGMYKTRNNERFGNERLPRLDVALPLTLRAPDGKCQVVIATHSAGVTLAPWVNVWLAVKATVLQCVSNGKGGTLRVFDGRPSGTLGIFISVMDEQNP